MEIKLIIPDDFINQLAAKLSEQAEKLAAGQRLVELKEAVIITKRRRTAVVAAYQSKRLAHYIIDGKPKFKVADLWTWLDEVRVEARVRP